MVGGYGWYNWNGELLKVMNFDLLCGLGIWFRLVMVVGRMVVWEVDKVICMFLGNEGGSGNCN